MAAKPNFKKKVKNAIETVAISSILETVFKDATVRQCVRPLVKKILKKKDKK
jgi:hypothetical protein